MKNKKANMPITPLIILILGILFGVLAYFFIKEYSTTGIEKSLSFLKTLV